ncbi:carotenoid ester lipase precursor [Epithele typhae]|uniref:carotenoid ester lipase precursor n=1 Tax=Epithele typhae TaxID=378194 RepID=UPI002007267F|nr:carotenoid ester lipase precursor [Epithele typhae]KAH9935220.1 carotenoid ester lipase precursor [Epithele typhae]
MPSFHSFCLLPLLAVVALAAPAALDKRASPAVTLDDATFIGKADGKLNKFLSIPFGKPPVGDLRFNLPVPVDAYTGTHTVTSTGPVCPQQSLTVPILTGLASEVVDFVVNTFIDTIEPSDEDCLSLSVIVPDGTKPGDDLPVAVWIFGGGFENGSSNSDDGGVIVKRSMAMNKPTIFVSINYRVSAFGFLPGKEVKEAGVGNLGLHDQRLAFRWVQKYISQFGGDPTKVTIWGQSAGAISVALHMVTNGGDTEGLFRGAFMQSGSPIPVGDMEAGQADYDALVSQTGCAGTADTLQCLRTVDFEVLKKAMDSSPSYLSYQALNLAWTPRVDGVFLTDIPQKLVLAGSVANIPFVTGNCDDEGTLFSLASLNVTTDAEFRDYVVGNYIPSITEPELEKLLTLYPSDPTQGAPFGTGGSNAVSPQFKRLAAMQGDLVFTAPRRFFAQQRAAAQPVWSYLSKRWKSVPLLGSFHATDKLNSFGGGELTDYLVNFATGLDPNGKTVPAWPQYSVAEPKLMTFLGGLLKRTAITADDFRTDAMEYMTELSLKYPL